LQLSQVSQLDFTLADERRYPCLALARQAWHRGGDSMAVLNAANEIAVRQFLDGRIRFTDIASLIGDVMERTDSAPARDLESVLEADSRARELARELVRART
jgi:1-deoxy-D-xylulose-5-phosphate reductoisomerase